MSYRVLGQGEPYSVNDPVVDTVCLSPLLEFITLLGPQIENFK